MARNPRIDYVIEQFKRNNIEFYLKDEASGHFHCLKKSNDALYQFWAGTGKYVWQDSIGAYKKGIGIHNLIKELD